MLLEMPKRRREAGQPDLLDRAKMRARREELKLTQEEAANRAGMPGGRFRWSELETGGRGRGVTLETLYAIAAALEVDPAELLRPAKK